MSYICVRTGVPPLIASSPLVVVMLEPSFHRRAGARPSSWTECACRPLPLVQRANQRHGGVDDLVGTVRLEEGAADLVAPLGEVLCHRHVAQVVVGVAAYQEMPHAAAPLQLPA